MAMNKVLNAVRSLLIAVLPVFRKEKIFEDTVIAILEIVVVVLAMIIAH